VTRPSAALLRALARSGRGAKTVKKLTRRALRPHRFDPIGAL
jgi:hypothetical protein